MWQYNNGTAELYHYGVLGMKWGVRRFQNKDGTLTKAGQTRYAEGASKETFKKDLKALRSRNGIKIKYDLSEDGRMDIKSVYSSDGVARGREYAQQLMDTNDKINARRKAASLAGMAVVAAGMAYADLFR